MINTIYTILGAAAVFAALAWTMRAIRRRRAASMTWPARERRRRLRSADRLYDQPPLSSVDTDAWLSGFDTKPKTRENT